MRLLALLALLPLAALADDGAGLLPMWKIEGDTNTVYLLGSVHLLRESDYPLPNGIDAAYRDAEELVMELDMDDLDPAAGQRLVAELGMIDDGRTLRDLMGAALYGDAVSLATDIDIPLENLANAEPWLAAITIEQMMLARIGFNPAFGIESHLLARAQQDQKDIHGLEEIEEQLGLLDGLSEQAQRTLLMETLKEAGRIGPLMDGMIMAWKRGDMAYLETQMLADMRAHDELYQTIVVNRNRNWVDDIEDLLDDEQDYLIVVGTLHLVGEESVQNMLQENGAVVRQVSR